MMPPGEARKGKSEVAPGMSGRIRVGIVIGQLHRGGAERQVYELATRLHRAVD